MQCSHKTIFCIKFAVGDWPICGVIPEMKSKCSDHVSRRFNTRMKAGLLGGHAAEGCRFAAPGLPAGQRQR
jgi:hypothetical protein